MYKRADKETSLPAAASASQTGGQQLITDNPGGGRDSEKSALTYAGIIEQMGDRKSVV